VEVASTRLELLSLRRRPVCTVNAPLTADDQHRRTNFGRYGIANSEPALEYQVVAAPNIAETCGLRNYYGPSYRLSRILWTPPLSLPLCPAFAPLFARVQRCWAF
jgi:hypothetical protein